MSLFIGVICDAMQVERNKHRALALRMKQVAVKREVAEEIALAKENHVPFIRTRRYVDKSVMPPEKYHLPHMPVIPLPFVLVNAFAGITALARRIKLALPLGEEDDHGSPRANAKQAKDASAAKSSYVPQSEAKPKGDEQKDEPPDSPSLKPCRARWAKIAATADAMANSDTFQLLIMACIIGASVLIGLQTYPELEAHKVIGPMFDRADQVILIIFASEIVLKTIGFDDKPWHYFRDAWNCFDFVVVVGTLVPFGGKAVAVLRLLRVLRIAKLFKSLTQLQIIMSGLFHGMKSIAYIGLLVLLLFYVFGVCAIMFFRPNDPIHFGSLHITMVTLFRCATVRPLDSRLVRRDFIPFRVSLCLSSPPGALPSFC